MSMGPARFMTFEGALMMVVVASAAISVLLSSEVFAMSPVWVTIFVVVFVVVSADFLMVLARLSCCVSKA